MNPLTPNSQNPEPGFVSPTKRSSPAQFRLSAGMHRPYHSAGWIAIAFACRPMSLLPDLDMLTFEYMNMLAERMRRFPRVAGRCRSRDGHSDFRQLNRRIPLQVESGPISACLLISRQSYTNPVVKFRLDPHKRSPARHAEGPWRRGQDSRAPIPSGGRHTRRCRCLSVSSGPSQVLRDKPGERPRRSLKSKQFAQR